MRCSRPTLRPAAARLHGVADDAELVADLAAQEEEGDDRDDRDQGEDECIFGEALSSLTVVTEMIDDRRD